MIIESLPYRLQDQLLNTLKLMLCQKSFDGWACIQVQLSLPFKMGLGLDARLSTLVALRLGHKEK